MKKIDSSIDSSMYMHMCKRERGRRIRVTCMMYSLWFVFFLDQKNCYVNRKVIKYIIGFL